MANPQSSELEYDDMQTDNERYQLLIFTLYHVSYSIVVSGDLHLAPAPCFVTIFVR